MSIDASDFVEAALTEQQRRNALFDQPDADDLVTDFQSIGQVPAELIGFQADSLATTAMPTGHKWGDVISLTQWGFFKWAT